MIEYCLKFVFHSLRSSHYLQGRVTFSVESIVEEVGLSQLLDRHLERLFLGIAAAAAAIVATTLATTAARFAYRRSARVSADLLGRLRRRTLLLLLPSKPCCSGCLSPSCSCGSSSSSGNPDSSQAPKSKSLSSGAAGISESYKVCLPLLLKSQVSHANRPQSAKLPLVGPGIARDFDVSEPALSSGDCHIPCRYNSHALVVIGSDSHDVLPIGPPDEVLSSSALEPAHSDGFGIVSFSDCNLSGDSNSLEMLLASNSYVSGSLLSLANDPSSLKVESGS